MLRSRSRSHDARLPRVLFALLLCGSTAVQGQQSPPLTLGVRVRITHNESTGAVPLQGTVARRTADSLVLRIEDTERDSALAYSQIAGIAISRGMRTRTARGAGIGFLVGAFVGAALGATGGDDDACCMGGAGPNWILAAVGAVVTGLVGTITGSVIGAHQHTERWESIPPRLWRVGADTEHAPSSVSPSSVSP